MLELALGAAPLAHFNLDQIMMKTMNDEAPVLESSDRRKRFTKVRVYVAVIIHPIVISNRCSVPLM